LELFEQEMGDNLQKESFILDLDAVLQENAYLRRRLVADNTVLPPLKSVPL